MEARSWLGLDSVDSESVIKRIIIGQFIEFLFNFAIKIDFIYVTAIPTQQSCLLSMNTLNKHSMLQNYSLIAMHVVHII